MADRPEPPNAEEFARLLGAWRQGDCSLEEAEFVWAVAHDTDSQQDDFEVVEVRGLVVLTQTCDIVLRGPQQGFVHVAPLVAVQQNVMDDVARRRRVHYACVPAVADGGLVADLGRVMTMSKEALVGLDRVEGCRTDDERREFRQALRRKFARTALPDDFIDVIGKFGRRVTSKHSKNSREGRLLRDLWDVRVVAAPSWDAERVEVMLWFVCENEIPENAPEFLEKWLDLVPTAGRFTPVHGQFVTLDRMTARDWVESDPLDFDHLTAPESG